MAYDLLIKNGRVIDGSGMPAFHGDVAITHTLVTRSHTGTQRWVQARHKISEKFGFID